MLTDVIKDIFSGKSVLLEVAPALNGFTGAL
jgi:hypothetical protein